MNFQQAIQAHVSWKMRLSSYIAKPDHSLNAAVVSQDASCELGRWLRGEGRKYAGSPEFAKLVTDHARFHAAAGNVIREADSGQNVADEVALGGTSEYAVASNAVVGALMKMKSKVAV
jgi:hypothetical protein